MEIIPVIDIRHRVAVRAVAGRRADYRPLDTPLAASSDPCDVAQGLMALYPFRALYIADLDAIERRRANDATIAAIAAAIAPARVWIDAGFAGAAQAESRLAADNMDAVLGSESLTGADEAARTGARAVLSLDFSDAGFLGDPRLLADASHWPDRVIVMTLARVGVGRGPDVGRLRDIAARARGRRVYAAGGVRSLDDLRVLQEAGAAGALVATALHEGRLTPADIERLEAK